MHTSPRLVHAGSKANVGMNWGTVGWSSVVVLVLFREAVVVATGRKQKMVAVPISLVWSLKSWDHQVE